MLTLCRMIKRQWRISTNEDNTATPVAKSTTSTGPLPFEILHKILHHLSSPSDKHTLSQCMQVSPTFNGIAAPILYRSIKLDSLSVLSQDPPKLATDRKTLSKIELLRFAEEIELGDHFESECTFDKNPWEGVELSVQILRREHDPGRPDHDCPYLEHIKPRKLVFKGDDVVNPFHKPISADPSLDSIVSIVTPDKAFAEGAVRLELGKVQGNQPRSHICVIWTGAPGLMFNPRVVLMHDSTTTTEYTLELFISAIIERTSMMSSPNELVVVNITALLQSMWPADPGDNARLLYLVKQSFRENHRMIVDHQRPPGLLEGHELKSAAEIEATKIQFIDMETYLTEYDWEGEFTAEEIAPWQAAMERKRQEKRELEREVQDGGETVEGNVHGVWRLIW